VLCVLPTSTQLVSAKFSGSCQGKTIIDRLVQFEAEMQAHYHVFLSHAEEQTSVVDSVRGWLKINEKQVTVFADERSLPARERAMDSISDAMRVADLGEAHTTLYTTTPYGRKQGNACIMSGNNVKCECLSSTLPVLNSESGPLSPTALVAPALPWHTLPKRAQHDVGSARHNCAITPSAVGPYGTA
jgi:hypothetical protein